MLALSLWQTSNQGCLAVAPSPFYTLVGWVLVILPDMQALVTLDFGELEDLKETTVDFGPVKGLYADWTLITVLTVTAENSLTSATGGGVLDHMAGFGLVTVLLDIAEHSGVGRCHAVECFVNMILREFALFDFVQDYFEWFQIVQGLVLNIGQAERAHRPHA